MATFKKQIIFFMKWLNFGDLSNFTIYILLTTNYTPHLKRIDQLVFKEKLNMCYC